MIKLIKDKIILTGFVLLISIGFVGISLFNSAVSEKIFNDLIKDATLLNGNLVNNEVIYESFFNYSTAHSSWTTPSGLNVELEHEITNGIMGIDIYTTLKDGSELKKVIKESQQNPFQEPFEAKTFINSLNGNQRTSFFFDDLIDDRASLIGFNGFFKIINNEIKAKVSMPTLTYSTDIANFNIDGLLISFQGNVEGEKITSTVLNSAFKRVLIDNSIQKVDLNAMSLTLSSLSSVNKTNIKAQFELLDSSLLDSYAAIKSKNIYFEGGAEFSNSVIESFAKSSNEVDENKIAVYSQELFSSLVKDLKLDITELSYSGEMIDAPYYGKGSSLISLNTPNDYDFNDFVIYGINGLVPYMEGSIRGDFSYDVISSVMPPVIISKILDNSVSNAEYPTNLIFDIKLEKRK